MVVTKIFYLAGGQKEIFLYRAGNLWNSLPQNIVMSPGLDTFTSGQISGGKIHAGYTSL